MEKVLSIFLNRSNPLFRPCDCYWRPKPLGTEWTNEAGWGGEKQLLLSRSSFLHYINQLGVGFPHAKVLSWLWSRADCRNKTRIGAWSLQPGVRYSAQEAWSFFNNINRWSWYNTSISHIEGEAPAWYRPFIYVYTSFEENYKQAIEAIKSVYETESWTPEARTDGCLRSSTVDDSSGNGFEISTANDHREGRILLTLKATFPFLIKLPCHLTIFFQQGVIPRIKTPPLLFELNKERPSGPFVWGENKWRGETRFINKGIGIRIRRRDRYWINGGREMCSWAGVCNFLIHKRQQITKPISKCYQLMRDFDPTNILFRISYTW